MNRWKSLPPGVRKVVGWAAVMLPGRWDVSQGDKLTAIGVLKVITTPAAVVNGQNVPATTSIVVVGVRVR